MSQLIDQKSYSISEILRWYRDEELILSPKFQRNQVWNDQAKSYLIDTILRGLPMPVIFVRNTIDVRQNKTFREVIDGQQRLRAIISFYNDKFKTINTLDKSASLYTELIDEDKEYFLQYEVAVMIVKTKDDASVYDMFARFNTNNYVLNRQEIRNARYWGEFKTLVYELGSRFKPIILELCTFDDKRLIRMKDYELINSLIILLLDGIRTETPKTVDSYYQDYDKIFDRKEEIRGKFLKYIEFIRKILDERYEFTYFNKPVYIYTLIACLEEYSRRNDCLPDISVFIPRLSELEFKLQDENINKSRNFQTILHNHKVRTTNLKERNLRITMTYHELFGT